MNQPNLAVYAEGCLYPVPAPRQPIAATIGELQQSGFTTAILGLFHIGRDTNISPPQILGDLYFNDTLVMSQGRYVGHATWPATVAGLIGGSVTTVCASVGGGGPVFDFTTVENIYNANGNAFVKTNLMANFAALRELFPSVSIIDIDCEDNQNQASLVAFCQMLADMGFGITFCPYSAKPFWAQSLNALNAACPGAVRWWNLQCYDGGGGNQPADWAAAIAEYNPGFATDGFLLAGDWTSDSPGAVQALMASFDGVASLGGGFIWTLDDMIAQGVPMRDYASALSAGLQASPAALALQGQ